MPMERERIHGEIHTSFQLGTKGKDLGYASEALKKLAHVVLPRT